VTVRVPVPAGGDASYRVVIGAGALQQLPALVSADCPAARYAVIADATVAPLYGEPAVVALTAAGLSARLHSFPAGEASKTRATWGALTDALPADGHGRDSALVAVGGGVTGDLAGFTAATLHRGIPVVQVPTSTVAMLDAAVGGKTGVDTAAGKNLVGTFHAPRLVVADLDTLQTLPAAAFAAGLAEAVKHGAIADRAYLTFIAARASELLARDPAALAPLVTRSVEIKAAVVGIDPRDAGRRATLNFGHTVGHAIEAASGFRIAHGDAVAMGLVIEARLGGLVGRCSGTVADELATVLTTLGLPVALPPDLAPGGLLAAMHGDKKTRAGQLRFAIPIALGGARDGTTAEWTVVIADEAVREVLAESVASQGV